MGFLDVFKQKKAADLFENPDARVRASKGSLNSGTLLQIMATLAQNPEHKVARTDDRFLNDMLQETPQRILDYQNSQIDKTTRGVVGSVLASAPLERAANTIGIADANALDAKARYSTQTAGRDIQLRNNYLTAKQRRLDMYNAAVADAENKMIQNNNTKTANLGAIGANYYNELQKVMANEVGIYQRDKNQEYSMGLMQKMLARVNKI